MSHKKVEQLKHSDSNTADPIQPIITKQLTIEKRKCHSLEEVARCNEKLHKACDQTRLLWLGQCPDSSKCPLRCEKKYSFCQNLRFDKTSKKRKNMGREYIWDVLTNSIQKWLDNN